MSVQSEITRIQNGVATQGTLIGQIQSALGNGTYSRWIRPAEWGQYPSEFQAEKDKEDSQRTMEAIYLLYHHNVDKFGDPSSFAGFRCTITGGYVVERGHMVGTTFTVDRTTAVESGVFYIETFTNVMPEYILYRIRPTVNGNTFSAFVLGHTNVDLNNLVQIVVESYGRTHIDRLSSMRSRLIRNLDIINYGTTSNMSSVFSNCGSLSSLDVSGWDTSAVTNMSNMFSNCGSLSSLDVSRWDTSAVTNMSYMFNNCNSLSSLDVSRWDTSAVTNMSGMFSSCATLSSLDVSGWDTSAVTNMSNMFYNCRSLILFNSCSFHISVSLSSSTRLTHDSLMSVINNLATVITSQILTLGSTNLNKLTEAEKQIAIEKGWTLV